MNIYYFTFGDGQPNEGKVLPIHANNIWAAREKMFELYGDRWSFCYTEEDCNGWKQRVANEHLPVPIEREMPPVYVYSEEVEG